MMNLSWLEDFLALAATGNFSRAARESSMTQPAFSRRIRALEDWLGVALFDRTTHPATLTEAGAWFQTVARDLLARVDGVPEQARAVAASGSSTLHFAATHALSLTFLPAWLRGFESRVATGPIQLSSNARRQCEALMLRGHAQFMLCHAHPQVPGGLDDGTHPMLVVGRDVLVPVSAPAGGAPRHSLARTGSGVPVLAYGGDSGLSSVMRERLQPRLEAIGAQTVFTASLAAVLKSMALDGRGIAWLPASLIEDELVRDRLVLAGGEEWYLNLDIRLYRHPRPLPPAAENFWTVVAAGLAASDVALEAPKPSKVRKRRATDR